MAMILSEKIKERLLGVKFDPVPPRDNPLQTKKGETRLRYDEVRFTNGEDGRVCVSFYWLGNHVSMMVTDTPIQQGDSLCMTGIRGYTVLYEGEA